MARSVRLKIEHSEDEITVFMPGTKFAVAYQKSADAPGLIAKAFWARNDLDGPIALNEFLALACKAANDRAREFGWVV